MLGKIIVEVTRQETHEYQGGIEVLVVLLDVVRIILSRFLLVHRVEIESRVIVLDGLEERSESIFKTVIPLRSAMRRVWTVWQTYHLGSIRSGRDWFSFSLLFSTLSMNWPGHRNFTRSANYTSKFSRTHVWQTPSTAQKETICRFIYCL